MWKLIIYLNKYQDVIKIKRRNDLDTEYLLHIKIYQNYHTSVLDTGYVAKSFDQFIYP